MQKLKKAVIASLLPLFFCPVSEAASAPDNDIPDWLAFLETSDWNQTPISCHAVVIQSNWALSTNDCVPELPAQEIMLRFSSESNHAYNQVRVTDVIRPSTQHTSYPVLLKLETALNQPFPSLAFKSHPWFDSLNDSYPLWTVYYLKRLKRSKDFLLRRPQINVLSNSVRIKDQSDCIPYVRGLDWKICSIPAGSERVLSHIYQRGSVLLDQDYAVTGLGYPLYPENTTMGINYFIPLTPFRRFINKHTGSNYQIDNDLTRSRSEL